MSEETGFDLIYFFLSGVILYIF